MVSEKGGFQTADGAEMVNRSVSDPVASMEATLLAIVSVIHAFSIPP